MHCERRAAGDDPHAEAAQLRALVPSPDSVRSAVTRIISRVRAGGDKALIHYTKRFDTGRTQPGPLVVPAEQLDAAQRMLDPAVRFGLEQAIENVRRVATEGLRGDRSVELGGYRVLLREAAVARAAIYVPGGRAPYPSTVVMGVVPARVAGVEQIAVCAPPARDGRLDAVVLAACRLARASVVYAMGGAQAIAALAYGTESVRPVDVIVGPGNLYVQEAKRQVLGQVGIDGFAGPSDLVVIADGDADPAPLALDLLAQSEHGPGTLVIGISSAARVLDAWQASLHGAADTGAVACLVHAGDIEQAGALASALAPEHLQLVGPSAERLAPAMTQAGCVFVGPAAATAFGDYIAGSNHILPTAGAARFQSALTPAHFRRSFTEVQIGSAAGGRLARIAAPVARAEGFELHARSMEARIRDNG